MSLSVTPFVCPGCTTLGNVEHYSLGAPPPPSIPGDTIRNLSESDFARAYEIARKGTSENFTTSTGLVLGGSRLKASLPGFIDEQIRREMLKVGVSRSTDGTGTLTVNPGGAVAQAGATSPATLAILGLATASLLAGGYFYFFKRK